MKVLVACEFSGIVREAFRRKGHDAWSCDLLSSEIPGKHIQGDVIPILLDGWDLMIAHPPCTYLSRAGARWWHEPSRIDKAKDALAFVLQLWNSPIKQVAIENPIGKLNKMWRYPDQTIEPYYFGESYSKRTCLWLKNLPPLISTIYNPEHEPLLPSNTGWGRRQGQKYYFRSISSKASSRTFTGIAEAMAEQWGK